MPELSSLGLTIAAADTAYPVMFTPAVAGRLSCSDGLVALMHPRAVPWGALPDRCTAGAPRAGWITAPMATGLGHGASPGQDPQAASLMILDAIYLLLCSVVAMPVSRTVPGLYTTTFFIEPPHGRQPLRGWRAGSGPYSGPPVRDVSIPVTVRKVKNSSY